MKRDLKKVLPVVVVAALSVMQSGCDKKVVITPPVVKLTASTAVSSTDSAHQHSFSIPFGDISPSPLAAGYQYRSDTVAGHSHVIALSQQQMSDLSNGMRLTLRSSVPSSGASHGHIWSIQGGRVLYDMNCYNCHSDTARNQSPWPNSKMGTTFAFNAAQTVALTIPGGAPQSTAVAAVPDPNFTPVATAPDGAALYASVCAGCHGALTASRVPNTSVPQIKAAIASIAAMKRLTTLTDAQIEVIASALVK